jgi:hypothetical protein
VTELLSPLEKWPPSVKSKWVFRVQQGGAVPDEEAQMKAADATDAAARHVLKERLPTAVACDEFRKTMQSIMGDPRFGTLPGTRVRPFVEPGIPRTTFP